MQNVDLCNELPFFALNDESLDTVLNAPASYFNFQNLEHDPLYIDNCKYNNELEKGKFKKNIDQLIFQNIMSSFLLTIFL